MGLVLLRSRIPAAPGFFQSPHLTDARVDEQSQESRDEARKRFWVRAQSGRAAL